MKRVNSSADITRDLNAAFRTALRTLKKDSDLVATTRSVGFVLPPRFLIKADRTGYQVFVKVSRFDERLLKQDPDSGGLLEYAKKGRSSVRSR